jgi:hypothetical protein
VILGGSSSEDIDFTMSGGSIKGNTAQRGGGIFVIGNGRFTLSNNGIISGNTAAIFGSGVYVAGNYSIFTMTGGIISGNTSSSFDGGGVYVWGDSTINPTFNKTGGVISDNTANGVNNQVYCRGTGGKTRTAASNAGNVLYAKYADSAWTYINPEGAVDTTANWDN